MLKNKEVDHALKSIGNPTFEEMQTLKRSPKVPKSQAHELAKKLFYQFSLGKEKLYPEDLLKFHRFIEGEFSGEFVNLKPSSIFKSLDLDDNGCSSKDDFELWVMLYLTYDDEIEILLSQHLQSFQAL